MGLIAAGTGLREKLTGGYRSFYAEKLIPTQDGALVRSAAYGRMLDKLRLPDANSELLVDENEGIVSWQHPPNAVAVKGVVFEKFESIAGGWSVMQEPSRIEGSWVLSGVDLEGVRAIRATGLSISGSGAHFIEKVSNVGEGMTEVGVVVSEDDTDASGNIRFDNCYPVAHPVMRVGIKNTGNSYAENVGVDIDGVDAGLFRLQGLPPKTLAPGGIWYFSIEQKFDGPGPKQAILRISADNATGAEVGLRGNSVNELNGGVRNEFEGFLDMDRLKSEQYRLVPTQSATYDLNQLRIGNIIIHTANVPPVIHLVKSDEVVLSNAPYNLQQGDEVIVAHGDETVSYQLRLRKHSVDLVRLVAGTIDNSFFAEVGGFQKPYIAFSEDGILFTGGSSVSLINGSAVSYFEGGFLSNVETMATYGGGRILVGKDRFGSYDQISSNLLMIVNGKDIDPAFIGHAIGSVKAIATDQQGRILISREFVDTNARVTSAIARFMPDGTLDDTYYTPEPVRNTTIEHINPLRNGKIVVTGYFAREGGGTEPGIRMLLGDGQLDPSFQVPVSGDSLVTAEDNNGNLIVGGNFTMIGGVNQSYLAKISPAGVVDTTFRPLLAEPVVSIVVDAENRFVLGGRMMRILPDGSVDSSIAFEEAGVPLVPSEVQVAVHPNGSIYRCGYKDYEEFNGSGYQVFKYIGVESGYETFVENFTKMVWIPSGGTPQPRRLRVEVFRDGAWVREGDFASFDGVRWETDLSTPVNAIAIRVRNTVIPQRLGESTLPGDTEMMGGPLVSLSVPAELNFGTAPSGFTNTQDFKIKNDGNVPLIGLQVDISGAGAGAYTVEQTLPDLTLGEEATVGVRFTSPTAGAAMAVPSGNDGRGRRFLPEYGSNRIRGG